VRPVNLIPPELRRGDRAPLRSGPLAYVIVGGLAAALIAVTALVMTQNSITDRENEVAALEVDRDAAMQRAQALAPYAEFASLQASRQQTITSLAQSRFDWERVLRELALIIPADVSLSSLEGSAAGAEGEETGAPALTMTGCAADQNAVAGFMAALEDIDGITKVELTSSERSGSSDGESQEGAGECSSRPGLATFTLGASFDAVAGAPLEATPAAPPATAPVETNSTQEQIDEAKQATNLIPGVAR
jgi:Tfp pilus assembly protein PilN